jgi:hypothetical protein
VLSVDPPVPPVPPVLSVEPPVPPVPPVSPVLSVEELSSSLLLASEPLSGLLVSCNPAGLLFVEHATGPKYIKPIHSAPCVILRIIVTIPHWKKNTVHCKRKTRETPFLGGFHEGVSMAFYRVCACMAFVVLGSCGKKEEGFEKGRYLVGALGVFNTPSATGEAAFEIGVSNPSGTGQTALKASALSERRPIPERWRGRIAYETARALNIEALVDALRAGERVLDHSTQRSALLVRNGASSFTFPTSNDVLSLTALPEQTKDGLRIQSYIDQGTTATQQQAAQSVVQQFLSTFKYELGILGHTTHAAPMDRNNDGALTVVFTNHTTEQIPDSVVGFFAFQDFLAAADQGASGNVADILWVRIPSSNGIAQATSVGTMAHEYVHLVSYAVRVFAKNNQALKEVLWLDEGMAHAMEDLTGWGASNVDVLAEALDSWSEGGFAGTTDGLQNRGRSYMRVRHAIDTEAKALGAVDAASDKVREAASTVYQTLLREETSGHAHSVFAQQGEEGQWRWVVGVYCTGAEGLTHKTAHAYDFLPVARLAVTQKTTGFNPYGTYANDNAETVVLKGPALALEDWDASENYENSVPLSGTVLLTTHDAFHPEEDVFLKEGTDSAVKLKFHRLK